MKKVSLTGGVWSATPTPLDLTGQVDVPSVQRLVDHHVRMGCSGLMLAGSCGEGPWLTDGARETLVRAAAAASAGRLRLAVQVTDSSAVRTLQNIEAAARWG